MNRFLHFTSCFAAAAVLIVASHKVGGGPPAQEPQRTSGEHDDIAKLLAQIGRVQSDYRQVLTLTDRNTPWEAIHALLALGADAPLYHGAGRTTTLAWIARSEVEGRPFIISTAQSAVPRTRPPGPVPTIGRVQGHPNQFLAVLAQLNVNKAAFASREPDAPLDVTWPKLMWGAWHEAWVPGEELSWTLMTYIRYFDDLPAEEPARRDRIAQAVKLVSERDVRDGACESAHALMALHCYLESSHVETLPAQVTAKAKLAISGAAEALVPDLVRLAKAYLDGSHVPRIRALATQVVVRRLGHHLEWLAQYHDGEVLKQQNMRVIAAALATALAECRNMGARDVGATSHAVRALSLYAKKIG